MNKKYEEIRILDHTFYGASSKSHGEWSEELDALIADKLKST